MRKNITVGLLRGGLSSERKISNASAKCVKSALISLGYKVLDIDVRDDFLTWVIKHGKQVDIFFNALHGTYGEDGKIQGVLEFTGIPYTHSGVTASAIGMDKDLSKKIFINAGVNVPRGKVLFKNEILKKDPIKRPYVIKPISEGSSLGIFIIKKTTSIEEVLKKIKKNEVLVEEYIEGNDYTVALMDGKALGILEIKYAENFYNYTAKYKTKKTIYSYPQRANPNFLKKVIRFAELVNKETKCSGITRVDFRIKNTKKISGIYVLEINTQPGLTKTSLVPKIAKQAGISFENLIDWIVKDAKANKV